MFLDPQNPWASGYSRLETTVLIKVRLCEKLSQITQDTGMERLDKLPKHSAFSLNIFQTLLVQKECISITIKINFADDCEYARIGTDRWEENGNYPIELMNKPVFTYRDF